MNLVILIIITMIMMITLNTTWLLLLTIDNLQTAELAAQLDKDLPGGSPVVTSWPKYGEYCYESKW